VAVTPKSGETLARRANYSGFGESFTVKNTGTQSDTYAFTCTGSANVTCDPSLMTPTSASLASGASVTVSVGYRTGSDGSRGQLSLGAASAFASDQGSYIIRLTNSIADVIPVNGWTRGAFTSSSYSARFTVSNPDVVSHKYGLGCYGSDASVVCPTTPLLDSVYLMAGTSASFDVGYSISPTASGNGYVVFSANDRLAQGRMNFAIWPNVPHAVSVTPANGTGPNLGSFTTGFTTSFTVRNVGTSSETYSFTCPASANVTCTSVTPASAFLNSLDSALVTVTYNVGASGSAYVGVTAANASANNTGQLTFTIVPSTGYAVAVTPRGKSVGVLASASASVPFTVQNTGRAQNTYTITASCTGGAILSGCTASATPVTIPAGGTSRITVSYTSGGPSTTGRMLLTATQSNDAGVRDTGWVNLATGTAQAPTVAVATANPGVTVERDLCLTVGLAGGAAMECGDLRLAHRLPVVRTMGRARAPVLAYSSAQAHPYPLVAAEVTLPAGAANPDSVEAVLLLNGVEQRRARWAGSDFSPSGANRIVIGFDALSVATGVYSYTLDVRNLYGASVLAASPVASGEVIVVNRSQSAFGAGWWLAGLERLSLDSMLWVGGDGNARVYRPTGIANVWAALVVNRPDTLKQVGSEYVRLLPGNAEVWFDAQGRHVRTVSRLKHDTTWFYYGSFLDSLKVPPASEGLKYVFTYTGGVLTAVTAPGPGATSRATTLTVSGGQVTAINDPDTSTVSFTYDAAYTNRIKSRTDRVGTVVSYFFDAAGKVARDTLDPGSSQPVIVRQVRPLESVGFVGSPAPDTAAAYALVVGPRTDVGDSTRLWLDRFGAPRHVRNALGQETFLARQDPVYPALVTRVQSPNGRVVRAVYDARGHVSMSTDSGAVGVTGQAAVTRSTWDPTWDALTLLVPPEQDSTVIGIDATTGHRLWQQNASGSGSRVTFAYYANGLLNTILEPAASAVTTLNYDVRGNLRQTISPLGFRDSVYRDNAGRDTLTRVPIDSLQTMFQWKRTAYDLADRVTQSQNTAPAVEYRGRLTVPGLGRDTTTIGPDTLIVTNGYDKEGHLTVVTSYGSRGPVDELYTYDRAGRLLSKRLGSGPTSFTYDASGNVVTQTYRGPFIVTATYDALNRLVRRVVPRRVYARTDCQWHAPGPAIGGGTGSCLARFPLYPNVVGDSLEIPADTSVFAYDVAGNQVQADNRSAQVRRSYYPNGLLQTDTLSLRNYVGTTFGGHVYWEGYGYDKDGRRTWMKASLRGDSLAYAYSPANGALVKVAEGWRDSLTYTAAGRLDSLKVFPTATATSPGIKEGRRYDADGRLVRRERRTGLDAQLQLDSLLYDAQGRVAQARTQSAAVDQGTLRTTTAYAGLGAVLASEVVDGTGRWQVEEFRTDGLGNVSYNHWRSAADSSKTPQRSTFDAHGLLTARVGDLPPSCTAPPYQDTLYQRGDGPVAVGGGNVIRAGEVRTTCPSAATTQTATNSYYTADQNLAVVQRYDMRSDAYQHGAWEEYWYDALGRRVLVRSRRETALCNAASGNECVSFVQRTVWDGHQVLYEERTSGLDVVTGGAPNYGTVGYVHALGIDQPVALMDGRVIHYNWRGLGEASSWSDGTPADYELSGGSTRVAWPAGQGVYYRRAIDPYAGVPVTWIGSLAVNGQDGTSLLYRRNRYYDPTSGRFTQEDPIGLAGGLNLYGFANGDPINFSDPFGLCPPEDEVPCTASDYYALRIAHGEGNEFLNELGGTLASCGDSGACKAVIGTAAGGAIASRLYGLLSAVSSDPKPGVADGPGAGKDFSPSTKADARTGRCVFCGEKTTREPGPNQSNIDHAVPKSRGGNNTLDNAQETCRTCNLKKGKQTTDEFLRRQPQ
jgi:RHS repeat-associated protein